MFLDPVQQKKLTGLAEFPAVISLSFDIGLSEEAVEIHPSYGISQSGQIFPLPDPQLFDLEDSRTILIFSGGQWQKWQHFDAQTGKFYKMVFVEAGRPPTVEISGIKMHVTQHGDPALDTSRKLQTLGKISSRVLDCCCGLGYTALALARLPAVQHVTTVERDTNILQLCAENPWSRELFQSPKITVIQGDSAQLITGMEDNFFAAILHDPPRFALAAELYEVSFYRQCWRVLRRNGKMYHYTGDPNKKTRGKSLPEKTIENLRRAGFRKARKAYQGVLAQK